MILISIFLKFYSIYDKASSLKELMNTEVYNENSTIIFIAVVVVIIFEKFYLGSCINYIIIVMKKGVLINLLPCLRSLLTGSVHVRDPYASVTFVQAANLRHVVPWNSKFSPSHIILTPVQPEFKLSYHRAPDCFRFLSDCCSQYLNLEIT